MNRILPKKGDRCFYMHRAIIVKKVYTTFHLAIIAFEDNKSETCVDICTITNTPDYSNSISLRLLRRES